jgi:hypothetical protein
MAYPEIYNVTYSYAGFAQGLGNGAFPGTQLDNDMAGLEDGQANLLTFLQTVFTSEGVLRPFAMPTAGDLTAYTDLAVAAATTAGASATSAASSAGTATTARDAAQDARDEAELAQSATQTLLNSAIWAQCRLNWVSASMIRLDRFDGMLLTINGIARAIAAPGPTLAPTGLTPDTVYYVYAAWSGSAVTIEASTTAPATGTNGQQIKTGDATRTLVGMVSPITGPAWADSASARRVLSYHNRRERNVLSGFTTNRTTTSTSNVEINTENRATFLSWGDADERFALNGFVTHSVSTGTVYSVLALDAVGTVLAQSQAIGAGSAVLAYEPSGAAITAGLHTLLWAGRVVTAGTATYNNLCEIRGQIRG